MQRQPPRVQAKLPRSSPVLCPCVLSPRCHRCSGQLRVSRTPSGPAERLGGPRGHSSVMGTSRHAGALLPNTFPLSTLQARGNHSRAPRLVSQTPLGRCYHLLVTSDLDIRKQRVKGPGSRIHPGRTLIQPRSQSTEEQESPISRQSSLCPSLLQAKAEQLFLAGGEPVNSSGEEGAAWRVLHQAGRGAAPSVLCSAFLRAAAQKSLYPTASGAPILLQTHQWTSCRKPRLERATKLLPITKLSSSFESFCTFTLLNPIFPGFFTPLTFRIQELSPRTCLAAGRTRALSHGGRCWSLGQV